MKNQSQQTCINCSFYEEKNALEYEFNCIKLKDMIDVKGDEKVRLKKPATFVCSNYVQKDDHEKIMAIKDVFPKSFLELDEDHPAYKMKNEKVLKYYNSLYDDSWQSWPGRHKSIKIWAILNNGYAIGWNKRKNGEDFPLKKLID